MTVWVKGTMIDDYCPLLVLICSLLLASGSGCLTESHSAVVDTREMETPDLGDEADSLSEAEDVSVEDQVNDMWQYLDEQDDVVQDISGRLAALEMEVTTLKQAQDGILKALRDFSKKVLTNESFFGKVRKLFK